MFSFKKLRTPNRDLMELQQNCADAFQFFKNSFIFEGVLLGPITIGTTDTVIPHTLNRMPLGWFPVRLKGPFVPYETTINASNLTLRATSSVVCHLWVF